LKALKSPFDGYLKISSWAYDSRAVASVLLVAEIFNTQVELEVRTKI
jgi:hypothetical protein